MEIFRRWILLPTSLLLSVCAVAETVITNDAFDVTCLLRYEDSFQLAWPNLNGSSTVTIFTTETSSTAKTALLWTETFSNAPAKTGGTTLSLENFASSYADYGNLDWILNGVYPSPESGSIRLGTTSKKGSLVLPSLTDLTSEIDNLHLRVRLRTVESGNNQIRTVPFYLYDPETGTTNTWVTFNATTNWTTCTAALPSDWSGKRIMLHSFLETKAGRTLIDSIELLSGEEGLVTNLLAQVDVGTNTQCVVTDMSRKLLSVLVSCTTSGEISTNFVSTLLSVDLRESAGSSLLLAKSFARHAGTVAFDVLDGITAQTSWENLVTITGVSAFTNAVALTSIFHDTGSSTRAGIYATHAGGVSFLSLLPTRDKGVDVLLEVANNSPRKITAFNLTFDASQSTFPTNAPASTTLDCSYRVFENPFVVNLSEEWTELPSCCCDALAELPEAAEEDGYVRETKASGDVACTVAPGEVLVFRWHVPLGESHRPMLGFRNPCIRLVFSSGMVLSIR